MTQVAQPVAVVNNSASEITFLSIDDFKKQINASIIQVVKNPNTGKLFVSANNKNFKCQQNIDTSKPMKFIINDADLNTACLANVEESNNVVVTL